MKLDLTVTGNHESLDRHSIVLSVLHARKRFARKNSKLRGNYRGKGRKQDPSYDHNYPRASSDADHRKRCFIISGEALLLVIRTVNFPRRTFPGLTLVKLHSPPSLPPSLPPGFLLPPYRNFPKNRRGTFTPSAPFPFLFFRHPPPLDTTSQLFVREKQTENFSPTVSRALDFISSRRLSRNNRLLCRTFAGGFKPRRKRAPLARGSPILHRRGGEFFTDRPSGRLLLYPFRV